MGAGRGGLGAAARERAPATHFPSGSRRLPPGKGLSLTRTSAPAQDLGLRILVFGLPTLDGVPGTCQNQTNSWTHPGPRTFQALSESLASRMTLGTGKTQLFLKTKQQ